LSFGRGVENEWGSVRGRVEKEEEEEGEEEMM
jgi:hypothetical protein